MLLRLFTRALLVIALAFALTVFGPMIASSSHLILWAVAGILWVTWGTIAIRRRNEPTLAGA